MTLNGNRRFIGLRGKRTEVHGLRSRPRRVGDSPVTRGRVRTGLCQGAGERNQRDEQQQYCGLKVLLTPCRRLSYLAG
jgi:hypothetical protein